MASAGLRSIWKTKKYFILEKNVKIVNFKQNWNIRYSKQQKIYQTDRGYCIKHLWEVCKKIGHSDPIYMPQLSHLIRFPQVSPIIKYSRVSFLQ